MKFSHIIPSSAPSLLAWMLTAIGAMAGTPATAPLKTAAAAEPKSAGLLNDALRLASPSFSAWDIGGQFRFRYELKDDAGSFPNRDFISHGVENDNDYFLFREKLHIGWQPESWLKFYVQGRGSQVESDERPGNPEQDVWDLHQAYLQIGDAKQSPLILKIGRQEMTYGDQRFIGIGDWGNTGRSFDAVVLRFAPAPTTWVDVFTSRVVIAVDDDFNESNDYDQFSGIYASTQELWKGVETQAFFLARNVDAGSPNAIAPGVGGPTERDVYTYGIRLKSQPGFFSGWDFAFEGAGQFGEVVSSGISRDLEAFILTTSAGYTFKDLWAKPRLGLGYDYASGDSNPGDDTYETFEPLFGTNHSVYGLMDLIGPRNLNSPRISLALKPTKKLALAIDYLLFWLADEADSFYPESGSARNQNGYGRNPDYGSYVGSELDIVAKYAVTPWAELQLGYGHFFPGEYIKNSVGSIPANGGATGADWFYVQTTINF